jgi:error-prone DNA polymerase
LLLEDEEETVNIIVSPEIYERARLTVRTEPLVIVDGRLERHASAGGAINIVARAVRRLEVDDRVAAQVKDFSLRDAIELARQAAVRAAAAEADAMQRLAATGTDDFRAVAPPVMNFGAGRRR